MLDLRFLWFSARARDHFAIAALVVIVALIAITVIVAIMLRW